MKKLLMIAFVFAIAAMTSPLGAFAEPPGGGGPNGGGAPTAGGAPGGGDPAQFEQRKTEIAQKIGEHIAQMQEVQKCVEAAKDPEGLRSCMPRRPDQGGSEGGHGPGDHGSAPEGK